MDIDNLKDLTSEELKYIVEELIQQINELKQENQQLKNELEIIN